MLDLELYKGIIIQIATHTNTGTGFYVQDFGCIVTNFHVVKGNDEVAIIGENFSKTITKVWFSDPLYDIALLEAPANVTFPFVPLSNQRVSDRDSIVAIGHPYGLKYTTTQGIVSKAVRLRNDIEFIQVDVAINPGNSGGTLVNQHGEVVGVNSFKIKDGHNLGFALPVHLLIKSVTDFKNTGLEIALRCSSCTNIVSQNELKNHYCPHCGASLESDLPKTYKVAGVPKVIEEVLEKLGKDIKIARGGHHRWEIREGSATIRINYHQESGAIFGDAYLCKLPKTNIGQLYNYLLHENYKLKYLRFSVNQQDIVLSLVIYSQFLKLETALEQIEYLLKKADDYDDILVEKYGALWGNQDKA